MSVPRPLQVAITLWRRGDPVPLDVLFALHQLGFDVPSLEAAYTR